MSTTSDIPQGVIAETKMPTGDGATTIESPATVKNVVQRRGDVSKCPICGSGIDADAFYCAKCHNYFCFHCRARLLKSDTQLQCEDQNCDYYAKLVCELCDQPIIRDEPPYVFVEPLDGYWPVWLLVSLILGAVTWYYTSFVVAAVTAILLFVVGGIILHLKVVNIFGGKRIVTEHRTSKHYICIRCKQPVKESARC